jgi:hypothetical protein
MAKPITAFTLILNENLTWTVQPISPDNMEIEREAVRADVKNGCREMVATMERVDTLEGIISILSGNLGANTETNEPATSDDSSKESAE